MTAVTRAAGAGRRRYAGLLAAALLCVAVTARGQPIKIPDFRELSRDAIKLKPGEPCERCGVVRAIREKQVQRPFNVPQGLSDPIDRGPGSTVVVGAVVAIPLGEGGKPFVGGIGTPEMRERFSETTYEIAIRLDDGGFTQVEHRDGWSFRVGDRVRVQGTRLELLAQ